MSNSQEVFNTILNKQHKIFGQKYQLILQDTLGPNANLAFTLQANAESFGFTFSEDLVKSLSHASIESLTSFWSDLSKTLPQITGAHKYFKPMYPNFPEQVMNASDFELYSNAFYHYLGDWIGLRILPTYSEKVRLPLIDKVKPKLLGFAQPSDINNYFYKLITANSSLSESDKKTVSVLFSYLNDKNLAENIIYQAQIPQKENLAFLGSLVLKSNLDFNTLMFEKFDTPTDLLRLSAAFFDGDVSLSKPTKIGKLSRPMRKAFLAALETQIINTNDYPQFVENMFTYKEMWVRFAHALHPGEHANKFPKISKVFDDLRSNNRPVTFNSKIEQLIQNKKYLEAASTLTSRPGVFARHLNRLLSLDNHNANNIVNLFNTCVNNISTPVLLQMHSHFKNQHLKTVRAFMPKGGLGSIFLSDEQPPQIDFALAMQIVESCEKALIERFKSFGNLGKTFVDPKLQKQNIPFAQRSASKAISTVSRGSRFENDETEKNIVRLFLWWNEKGINKEGKEYNVGRVDIDLSCVLMDENYKTTSVCSFYDLRHSNGSLTHSGDITSAPNGACEFIDVDLNKIDSNVRYIAMTISSYTQQKYADLPECFAGWMMREHAQMGEIFDARTVKNKIDLTSDSTQMMPAIYDVKNKEFIWADISIKHDIYRSNHVGNNMNSLAYTVKAITNLVKPNLYDLFMMHAQARGEIVNNKEDADTVFSLHDGITPYMFETISSEYMADKPVVKLEEQKAPIVVIKKRKIK